MTFRHTALFFICLTTFVFGMHGNSTTIAEPLTIKSSSTFDNEKNVGTISFDIAGGEGDVAVQIIHHYGADYTFDSRSVQLTDLKPGLYIIIVRDKVNNLITKNIELGLR